MRLPRQRRAGLLLAGVATLGWAAALAFAWFNASLRTQHQPDQRQLETMRKAPGAELDRQRQAAGPVPEEPKPPPGARTSPVPPSAPEPPKTEPPTGPAPVARTSEPSAPGAPGAAERQAAP